MTEATLILTCADEALSVKSDPDPLLFYAELIGLSNGSAGSRARRDQQIEHSIFTKRSQKLLE